MDLRWFRHNLGVYEDAMTLSIMTLSIMTLSIINLIATLSINDIRHNNIQHDYLVLLCWGHYAEYHIFIFLFWVSLCWVSYAESRGAQKNFVGSTREFLRGKYHYTVDLLFDWFGISCTTTDNFCFYLQNSLTQTSQTGGQWYSDTSPFSIPCINSTNSKFDQLGKKIQYWSAVS